MKTPFDEVCEALTAASRELSNFDYRELLEELEDEIQTRLSCLELDAENAGGMSE